MDKINKKDYFFDSYALIEINKGNPDYLKYKDSRVVITLLNLMEFYYALLKFTNKDVANKKFQKYLSNCIKLKPDIIMESAEFRHEFNKNSKFKISYIDAIGYITAKKLNIKFLTGDEAFRELPDVEFAK